MQFLTLPILAINALIRFFEPEPVLTLKQLAALQGMYYDFKVR